ncbi:hypothetical protein ACFL0D_00025 [Thermoproteota archaeon]
MKKVIIPIISAALLVVFAFFFIMWASSNSLETTFSSDKTVSLDIPFSKCVSPVTVSNARWQISMLVTNRSSKTVLISRVYLNEVQVDIYDLVHGGSLPDGNNIGTSVPIEGLHMQPNDTVNIYIWIGNKLFSSGSRVVIHFNDPNSVTLMKSVSLT